ncbi:unnamed protein product [Cladocopium goreaui]|uniref:Uncharacterized protein n=1 Tax=Cladocopium goreaui TaxID=2562237 RepID=A0A9P1CUP0_9DINO|nr:unnamed protein product [Cladocopium goreaui]
MALRYFNTFIDAEPEQVEASPGRLHRSKSWPQRCRSYTNVETTDGVNYVTKLESKWSVTYGERLQMAPASATDETDVTPMTSQSGPVEAAGEASEALQL